MECCISVGYGLVVDNGIIVFVVNDGFKVFVLVVGLLGLELG